MRCPDEDKLLNAAYMLKGNADNWWNDIRDRLEHRGVELTWQTFESESLNKYFLDVEQDQKEEEYLEFVQGDMSVDEYVAKFVKLSQLSNDGELPRNSRKEMSKLKRGLNWKIQKIVMGYRARDLEELINQSKAIENAIIREGKGKSSNPTKGTSSAMVPFTGQGRQEDKGKGSFRPQQSQQFKKGSSRKGKAPAGGSASPKCPICDRVHRGECWNQKITCFNCGQQGHYSFQYTQNKPKAPLAASRPQAGARVYTINSKEAA